MIVDEPISTRNHQPFEPFADGRENRQSGLLTVILDGLTVW